MISNFYGLDNYTYHYSGLGDRVQQTVNGTTITYILDLNTNLTQVLSDGTDTYLYGLSRIGEESTSWAYFLGDALGSVRQLTDSIGDVSLAQTYEPYGEVLASYGSGTSNYSFTGDLLDPSGLIFLRARYLNLGIGRFTSRDSWGGKYSRPLSLNKWMYTEGNPIQRIDPSGLAFCEPNDPDCLEGYNNTYGIMKFLFQSYSPHPKPESWGVVGDARKRSNVTESPPGITWNPNSGLRLATQFIGENQYYVDINLNGVLDTEEDYLGYGNSRPEPRGIWGFNLCGQWSIAIILEAITGRPHFLSSIYYALDKTHDATYAYQLGIALTAVTPPNKVDHWVHELNMRRKMQPDGTHTNYENSNRPYCVDCSLYPNWLRRTLNNGRYYIALVEIDTSENGVLSPNGGINHWVVITGFSSQWNEAELNSRWNWVRVMNPFLGREEYYWWNEFRNSVHPGHGLEVWEK